MLADSINHFFPSHSVTHTRLQSLQIVRLMFEKTLAVVQIVSASFLLSLFRVLQHVLQTKDNGIQAHF